MLASQCLAIGMSTLQLGVLVDSCLYGQMTVPPWRFFQANVLQGKALHFGTSAWHFAASEVGHQRSSMSSLS